ncbi:AraC family transcriptional regulator [Pseudomonas sp. LS1212]|nr:AraC family transcriptional regulator [Pseudomonas sp. LS1212]
MDVSLALQKADIDPQLLESPRSRVSAAAFARLWVALADLLDDEYFGIDSHPMRRGSFKLMCHALLDCKTLGPRLYPQRAVWLHRGHPRLWHRCARPGRGQTGFQPRPHRVRPAGL